MKDTDMGLPQARPTAPHLGGGAPDPHHSLSPLMTGSGGVARPPLQVTFCLSHQ